MKAARRDPVRYAARANIARPDSTKLERNRTLYATTGCMPAASNGTAVSDGQSIASE